ncbi:MAG: radical SAM protein [Bacteroidales bacterium]|nr:radical SAM protein [Bacteroidales bacterium]
MLTGTLFSIEEFAVNDGPGIRTTVFLKGCPLRCEWCHNPEGQGFRPEVMHRPGRDETCGYTLSSEALAARLRRDAAFFRETGGGVTFTGGEPLAQPDFLLEVMQLLGPEVHQAVETSGFAPGPVFDRVVAAADYLLFDIKAAAPALHRRCTGVDNALILANLSRLRASGKRFAARLPLIPGVNDSVEDMRAAADLLEGAGNLHRVELLRYHQTAGAKYPLLGRPYAPSFDTKAAPEVHAEVFAGRGMDVIIL